MIDPEVHPVRPLVVVLDEAAATDQSPPFRYLRRLLAAADATVWRYSDTGPPATARVLTAPHSGDQYAPGWIELRSSGPAYEAILTTDHGATLTSAWPGFQPIEPVAAGLGGSDHQADKVKDLLAACAASAAKADAFVTKRNSLLDTTKETARQANPYSVHDALSLVGLHLRSSNKYVVGTEGDPMLAVSEYNRGLFYLAAARTLTPAGWNWFSACVDTGDDSLTQLAQSVLERVDRTLRLRDDLYRWLMLPQNNDTADETLAVLDNLMLTLHGAFDAAARVAHRTLTLSGRVSTVGWHRREWIAQVDKAGYPTLADPVRPGTPGSELLAIIRSMRNTVHGQATSSVAVHGSTSEGGVDTQLALPSEDVARVLASVDALGLRDQWGIREFAPTRLLIKPAPFAEQIIAPAYRLLNTLLERTPVELLLDGQPSTLTSAPEHEDAFEPVRCQRILWQLGL